MTNPTRQWPVSRRTATAPPDPVGDDIRPLLNSASQERGDRPNRTHRQDVDGKPMRGAIRIAAVLAVASLVGTACTNDRNGAQPTTTTGTSTTRSPKPAPPDRNLRNVARAAIYSDGIAYVLPETAAQMICGALSPAEWRTVLGSDVGRAVYGDVDAKCRLSAGSVTIDMTRTVQVLGAVGERIADRRVSIEPSSASGRVAAAQAALVPLAEQDTRRVTHNRCNDIWRVGERLVQEYHRGCVTNWVTIGPYMPARGRTPADADMTLDLRVC
jgi:hypothetical protein